MFSSPHRRIAASLALALSAGSALQAQPIGNKPDSNLLNSVMRLHGLDERGAIERLAREEAAADLYQTIRAMQPAGYAGAWFDADAGQLVVALNANEQIRLVASLGAVPVGVRWSLAELDAARDQSLALIERHSPGLVRAAYTDTSNNQVVLAVPPGQSGLARQLLNAWRDMVSVVESDGDAQFSSGPVRGADGTRNVTWGGSHCSIGVSATGGYLTAGHCGFENDVINTPSSVSLGKVEWSSWSDSAWGPTDAAWVGTGTGWIPQAVINGYSDGVLTVPAKWSGTSESPLGATVCRYGQTSGGPHCGVIGAKDVIEIIGATDFDPGTLMTGLTQVNGSCTDDGDSGGPHVSASGVQIQGVNVGGNPTNTCPLTAGNVVWFQPINQVVSLVKAGLLGTEKPMLTAHGASTPTVHGLNCFQSTPTSYFCYISHYNSQGETTVSWSSTGGGSASGIVYDGYCATSSTATVTVKASNPYGTGASLSRIVSCHAIVP